MVEESANLSEEAMTRVGKGLLGHSDITGAWLVRAGLRDNITTHLIATTSIERWFNFIIPWQHPSSVTPLGIALRALGISDTQAWLEELDSELELEVRRAINDVSPLLIPPAQTITERKAGAITVLTVTRLLPPGGSNSLEFIPLQSL